MSLLILFIFGLAVTAGFLGFRAWRAHQALKQLLKEDEYDEF